MHCYGYLDAPISNANVVFQHPRGCPCCIVVALALIPEAIAFSIIAGVDPKVGLYASFCICVVVAFMGGRPGMISAATGAMALLMVTLVKDHGLHYLLAATLLCGVLQILAGFLKLGSLMRFVSRSVVTGFVNALAVLIFMAQLPELTNVTWPVYAMTAAGLMIIYLFPYVTKIGKLLPSPLVCILVLTAASIYLKYHPLSTNIEMVVTVIVVVATHNLAYGVWRVGGRAAGFVVLRQQGRALP